MGDKGVELRRRLRWPMRCTNVRGMRWLSTLTVSLGMATAAFAADVTFVRVWPQWRDADAFDRVAQYFGGTEDSARDLVLRSHADTKAGLYFVVRVKTATPLDNAKFVLNVIRPDSPDAHEYTFPVSFPTKGGVAQVGLTGADWPDGHRTHPVAWKLTLLDASGQPVATEQSFLWANPKS